MSIYIYIYIYIYVYTHIYIYIYQSGQMTSYLFETIDSKNNTLISNIKKNVKTILTKLSV